MSDEMFSFRGKTVDKITRYKWDLTDNPGSLAMISKNLLIVDHSYQRNTNEAKVLAIARDWSWIAFGAIVVAERKGNLYVIDGQHRLMAARKRSDISELPCVVFKTQERKEEAKGFLTAQTKRRPITSVEKFRALLTIEDKPTALVNTLLQSVGKYPGSGNSTDSVKCVGVLTDFAQSDPDLLVETWPLIVELTGAEPINKRLVAAIMYISKHIPEGMKLTDKTWKNRLLKVGFTDVMSGINRASAFYEKGGPKVWATGVVETMNKGLRNKLELTE
jgi:hypothetical protein